MTIRRCLRGVIVSLLIVGTIVVARPARAQLMTITVRTGDELLAQLRAVAKLAGVEAARPVLDALDGLDKGGTLKWLDRTKPVTATGDMDPNTGQPVVNLFLPITSRDDLLDAIKGFGFMVDDRPGVDGFSHKVVAPAGNGQAVYLLADPPAGYAVFTSMPKEAVAMRAIKPAELIPGRPGSVLVGLRLDRLPDPMKQAFLDGMKQRNEADRQRKAGETDGVYKGRMAGLSLADDGFRSLLRDGRELSLDADVDTERGRLALTLAVDAKPGTAMAENLGAFSRLRSRFRRLAGDDAVTLRGALPIPEVFRTMIRTIIDDSRAEAEKAATPEDSRMIALTVEALKPTLTGEVFDACMIMDAPAKGENGGKRGTNVVLFGVGVKGSKKIEATFREAIAKSKAEERKKVAFDLDHSALGTSIHRVELDPENLKVEDFGEPLMFLALPEGAAFGAVGGNGLPVLKGVLASLEPPAAGDGPQVEMDVAVARFARLKLGENEASFREAGREVFKGLDSTKDHIRLALNGTPNQLLLRLDADLPVLRFFYIAGAIQQKTKADHER